MSRQHSTTKVGSVTATKEPTATITPGTIVAALHPLAYPLDQLDELPGNPRRGDVEAVARSYATFGQRKPVVARKVGDRGVVIAGNHQMAAARRLGWSHLAVVWVDDDDETAAAFALADNRTADLGTYDDASLLAMIAKVSDAELLAATGFTDDDVAALVAATSPLPAPLAGDPDDVPTTAPNVTVVGDVWLLGPHRVMCGDSTSPTDIERLMADGLADMVWTDPPYGIDYRAMRGGSAIHNDANPDDASRVLRDTLGLLRDAQTYFVCCDWRSLSTIIEAMVGVGIEPKACIVWDKQVRVQNLDRYAKQHEFLIYAGPFGGQPTQATDIWQHHRDFNPDHPTPKPVALIEQALVTASSMGAVVVDPFGGSGSTLIACARVGRTARLMELDPHYVDVICKRWEQATGIAPIAEATGRAHTFLDEA